MLVLVMGREARGEDYETILRVGWSIRNRVMNPKYWGHDWLSVISHPLAYSSMVPPTRDNDPNLRVYPEPEDAKWNLVIQAAENTYAGAGPDPSAGANSYYDRSMDDDPPEWTRAATSQHIMDSGSLHFWHVQ